MIPNVLPQQQPLTPRNIQRPQSALPQSPRLNPQQQQDEHDTTVSPQAPRHTRPVSAAPRRVAGITSIQVQI